MAEGFSASGNSYGLRRCNYEQEKRKRGKTPRYTKYCEIKTLGCEAV